MRAGYRGKSDERALARVRRGRVWRHCELEQDVRNVAVRKKLRPAVDHEMTSGVLELSGLGWELREGGHFQTGLAWLMR